MGVSKIGFVLLSDMADFLPVQLPLFYLSFFLENTVNFRRFVVAALFVLFSSNWFVAVNGQENPKQIDFAHDVVPIFKQHCLACHGGKESEGGFSINSRALVLDSETVVPGKAEKSRLIELITSQDKEEQMPPKKQQRLSTKEITVLRAWIDQGVKWQEGFTFAPQRYEPPLLPRRVKLPPAMAGRASPIDRILDTYLAEQKQPRPLPLDDATFARRIYLDLLGLLPPREKLASFLRDPSRGKRRRLIQEVLANNQAYAEHWMTFWNDLLRNAYSGTGYIDNGRKQITGWLYGALLENKPYDRFMHELISPTAESEGFIRGIQWRGNVNASQTREIQFSQNIAQVFLGINMKCASCHDSFIDRWTLEETYNLSAIFATKPLKIHRCDKPTGQIAKPAWIFPELGQVDPLAPQPERLAQLADLMTHPENGRLTRTIVNRIWHRLMGRGIVHPIDAMHTPPWSADLLDYLGLHLSDNGYDLKKTIELIVSSQAYQSRAVVLSARPAGEGFVYTGPLAKRMTAEQFLDAVWSVGATWPQPDARAFRRDGRQQGGQLAAVLQATDKEKVDLSKRPPAAPWKTRWAARPVRAVFTPLDGLQGSLGRPNREQVVTSRPSMLTTLEAILLANGTTLADLLTAGAGNILAAHQGTSEELIEELYLTCLSRRPTRQEQKVAQELLGEIPKSKVPNGQVPSRQGVEDLLWVMLMLPEFQLIR